MSNSLETWNMKLGPIFPFNFCYLNMILRLSIKTQWGECLMVLSKEETIIVEIIVEPLDYAMLLDHTRFDPPAEFSLPDYRLQNVKY